MKAQVLLILFLAVALIFAPLCSADVWDVILAPAKVAEGLLWIPAIALVVSVGVPMYFLMKLDESIKGKETKNVS